MLKSFKNEVVMALMVGEEYKPRGTQNYMDINSKSRKLDADQNRQ